MYAFVTFMNYLAGKLNIHLITRIVALPMIVPMFLLKVLEDVDAFC